MEENSEIINEKLSKIAMLSEGVAQLFDGKTSTLVVLKEPEFKQWCKIFSKLNVDSNMFKVDISNVEFIFVLDGSSISDISNPS
jgi:hypothetical protein